MSNNKKAIDKLVGERNAAKFLFTAGPASLLPENLTGLRPCFGRGDSDYDQTEEKVLIALKTMAGQEHIVRMQGSASLALEVMILNFLYGRVLVISTGYYSDRLKDFAESAGRRVKAAKKVDYVGWKELEGIAGQYDWLVACSTETSCGLKLPIALLSKTARKIGARLMLDATASIGLEEGHEQADAIAFSSCKGLFGLTGASFISFNGEPSQEVDSFYLNLATHREKRMTGPYHAIASLCDVLPKHGEFRAAVQTNKAHALEKMRKWLTLPAKNQPFLCTHVSCEVTARDPRAVLYKPRGNQKGSVICHLGEAHLGIKAEGNILSALDWPKGSIHEI